MIENNNIKTEEAKLDNKLRPKYFKDFIGQEEVKKIKLFVKAAKDRQEVLDHFLFYGPPGLGKTTLAFILANEMGKSLKITSGPSISKVSDLTSIISNLNEGDFLFIDEIHRLNRNVEEVLYTAMEDFALDVVLGKGPSARTVRLDLPKFTLVGATTLVGLLTNPLRDRFGSIHKLKYYNENELSQIALRSSKLLSVNFDTASALEIAKRSRGTPRVVNRLVKRIRDIAQVENKKQVDKAYVDYAAKFLGVDSVGLTEEDRKILQVINDKFEGGPVGLSTLSAALSEDKATLEEVLEPFLIQKGFIKRTNLGRVITSLGVKHLKTNNN